MTIGKRIKSLRKGKKVTQEEIFIRAGIKKEYTSRIESDKLPNPTIGTIYKFAKALDVSIEELFNFDITI